MDKFGIAKACFTNAISNVLLVHFGNDPTATSARNKNLGDGYMILPGFVGLGIPNQLVILSWVKSFMADLLSDRWLQD